MLTLESVSTVKRIRPRVESDAFLSFPVLLSIDKLLIPDDLLYRAKNLTLVQLV